MGAESNYPQWKIIAWRYGRTFLAAFIGIFSVDQIILGTEPIDQTLLKSAIAAGVAAIFKLIRDQLGDENLSKGIINKLPF